MMETHTFEVLLSRLDIVITRGTKYGIKVGYHYHIIAVWLPFTKSCCS